MCDGIYRRTKFAPRESAPACQATDAGRAACLCDHRVPDSDLFRYPSEPCRLSAGQFSFQWPQWRSRRLGWRWLERWWRFWRRRWTIGRRRRQRIMVMTRRKLIQIIDQARLTEAIQKAEHRT